MCICSLGIKKLALNSITIAINAIDAVILVNAVLNGENISGGDLNSDEIVNILDIVSLINIILSE